MNPALLFATTELCVAEGRSSAVGLNETGNFPIRLGVELANIQRRPDSSQTHLRPEPFAAQLISYVENNSHRTKYIQWNS